MNITGTIKVINDTIVVSDKFKKRDFVVTTEEQYPQDILIQMTQDKCDVLNGYKVGDSVDVGINIRGREWTSPSGEVKYFNTIEGWKINKLTAPAPTQPTQQAPQEEEDDLPF
jgi:hypothetical protein